MPAGTIELLSKFAQLGLARGFDPLQAQAKERSHRAFDNARRIYKRGPAGVWPTGSSNILKLSSLREIKKNIENKFIVADQKFYKLWSKKIGLAEQRVFLVDARESKKSFEVAAEIAQAAADSTEWVALGGGLTCDLAAFAASLLQVNISFVPTTFLAAVDACVGGKTGVNLLGIKNIAGSFYPADQVHIFPKLFETLSDYDYFNGATEGLKLLLLQREHDEASRFWACCLARRTSNETVVSLAKNKARFIQTDTHDQAKRSLLNFGHTLGHLIETTSIRKNQPEPIGHGASVLFGMYLELKFLGRPTNFLEAFLKDRIKADTRFAGDLERVKKMPETFLSLGPLINDKKNKNQKIGFSATQENPECFIHYFEKETVTSFIQSSWKTELESLTCKN